MMRLTPDFTNKFSFSSLSASGPRYQINYSHLKTLICFFLVYMASVSFYGQQIAVLKYGGGGDWYANPTALPNLIKFCNSKIETRIDQRPATVEPDSEEIFLYPFIHMTGHGNVLFSDEEAVNLRDYLLAGGFLHIDDNYGMEPYLQKELKKVFPDREMIELGADHELFKTPFTFRKGLPKIHEHNGKRPQALGISINNRLVLLFTFESDLGDGWENKEVHNDPEELRQKALEMGANILNYAFKN